MIDFQNIAYLPLDLPKISNKNHILDSLDYLDHSIVGHNIWNSFNLLEAYANHDFQEGHKWATSSLAHIPELIYFIETNIPLIGFRMARLYRQITEVESHIDAVRDPKTSICGDSSKTTTSYLKYAEPLEPLGYKILINGTRNNHFYKDRVEKATKSLA